MRSTRATLLIPILLLSSLAFAELPAVLLDLIQVDRHLGFARHRWRRGYRLSRGHVDYGKGLVEHGCRLADFQ